MPRPRADSALAPRRPPRLRPGARVGLVAPAGPVTEDKIETAFAHCARFGLEPVLGKAARNRTGFLAGTDAERLADLAGMLADPAIDAVWALRGGYGTLRLLPDLPPPPRPRAYIGFSDNTVLHLWLLTHGVVPFHGPHAGGELPPLAEACFHRVLFDAAPAGELPLPDGGGVTALVGGRAEGRLLGGNLALVAALCGTRWQPSARDTILFLEDVGEAPYRVDRLLRQLELAGVLDGVAGLALGQFTECGTEEETSQTLEVLGSCAQRLGVPTLLGLPVGHVPDNWTLPLGVRARLDADAGTLALLEPAVAEWEVA